MPEPATTFLRQPTSLGEDLLYELSLFFEPRDKEWKSIIILNLISLFFSLKLYVRVLCAKILISLVSFSL